MVYSVCSSSSRERIPDAYGRSLARLSAHGWIANNAADFASNLPLHRNLGVPSVATSDLRRHVKLDSMLVHHLSTNFVTNIIVLSTLFIPFNTMHLRSLRETTYLAPAGESQDRLNKI